LDGGSVNGEDMTHQPLEENIVKSLDWMYALVKSRLFNLIWDEQKVKKIAVCGGSGSFLLGQAIRSEADFFVTADFKYHEFFDAEGKITIADIGHYESEIFTKELLKEILTEKFPTFAVNFSTTDTNPVRYFN